MVSTYLYLNCALSGYKEIECKHRKHFRYCVVRTQYLYKKQHNMASSLALKLLCEYCVRYVTLKCTWNWILPDIFLAHPLVAPTRPWSIWKTWHQWALTIYPIHPCGNFSWNYYVMQLVQTQNGKSQNVLVSIGKLKRKRKSMLIEPIAYHFWNVPNGMVRTV